MKKNQHITPTSNTFFPNFRELTVSKIETRSKLADVQVVKLIEQLKLCNDQKHYNDLIQNSKLMNQLLEKPVHHNITQLVDEMNRQIKLLNKLKGSLTNFLLLSIEKQRKFLKKTTPLKQNTIPENIQKNQTNETIPSFSKKIPLINKQNEKSVVKKKSNPIGKPKLPQKPSNEEINQTIFNSMTNSFQTTHHNQRKEEETENKIKKNKEKDLESFNNLFQNVNPKIEVVKGSKKKVKHVTKGIIDQFNTIDIPKEDFGIRSDIATIGSESIAELSDSDVGNVEQLDETIDQEEESEFESDFGDLQNGNTTNPNPIISQHKNEKRPNNNNNNNNIDNKDSFSLGFDNLIPQNNQQNKKIYQTNEFDDFLSNLSGSSGVKNQTPSQMMFFGDEGEKSHKQSKILSLFDDEKQNKSQ